MTITKRAEEFDYAFKRPYCPAIHWDDAASRAAAAQTLSKTLQKKQDRGVNAGYLGVLSKASEAQIVKGRTIRKNSRL